MAKADRSVTRKWKYGVHPSVAMVQAALAGLKARSGRTLDEWLHLVRQEGPHTEAERRAWLKSVHHLGTMYAVWIAERSVGKGGDSADPKRYLKAAEGYVDAMFSGPRVGLRPVYDALMEMAYSLGDDVRACPCATMVPVYRRRVIAQITPATRTRIDLGLALGDTKAPKRLVPTGGLETKDRITHAVSITSLADVDDEVWRWTKAAYERDA